MTLQDRLLLRRGRIIEMLRQGSTTAEVMSRDIGVALRTIYRDIEDLRFAGWDIDGSAGKGFSLSNRPRRRSAEWALQVAAAACDWKFARMALIEASIYNSGNYPALVTDLGHAEHALMEALKED